MRKLPFPKPITLPGPPQRAGVPRTALEQSYDPVLEAWWRSRQAVEDRGEYPTNYLGYQPTVPERELSPPPPPEYPRYGPAEREYVQAAKLERISGALQTQERTRVLVESGLTRNLDDISKNDCTTLRNAKAMMVWHVTPLVSRPGVSRRFYDPLRDAVYNGVKQEIDDAINRKCPKVPLLNKGEKK